MKTQDKTNFGKTALQVASLSDKMSTLEFLLQKRNKANDIKNLHAQFTITAKEVANHFGKTVQEVYHYLDNFKQKSYESTYKPILVQGKDWDYVRGRIHLSEESFEVLKTWIEKRRLTKKAEA